MRYYFDTSIWLDFFENRNELNLPKAGWVEKLINKIIKDDDKIVYSDVVIDELLEQGYNMNEINTFFNHLKKILIYAESNKKQFGKAKDLSHKRGIPIFDAFHALIARDNKSLMVTRDFHFKKLLDIVTYKKPEDFIKD